MSIVEPFCVKRSMGIIAWFSLFKLDWLRRCKTCGVRGSKCLCRRPSLALEHIFFLEERKNKFGARNFSHVSDTMMTSNSTMFTNSTNNGTGPASNLSNSTVVMRATGSFAESEVNPADYYYQATGAADPSDSTGELLTPRMAKKLETSKHRQQHQTRRQRSSNHGDAMVPDDVTPTALVRKGSGRMRSKARHNGDANRRPPIKEVVTGEFILYSEENIPVSLPHRQQQQQVVPHNRRRNNSALSAKMVERPQHKDEPGVSFQFYGRSGSGRGGVPPIPSGTMVASNRSLSSSISTNDSFMMSSNSISSVRASQTSDRVSIETNFGSFNPHGMSNGLGNTGGRFIESGYAPSIQEDDEALALEQLNGWLHASSVSTQDSFLMSR
ncbi:hypothetical protein BBO99_00003429 [Phytophthora kernoviae]|uniref:Uncharacterized protein n=2 Tax=Phytophthora kernoviae TaxID=325452 RepID=A0A3R7NIE6_9STRA|nr:hypothetical protein G195_003865 [Phytophthora kernoviae 00238/432]KAG2526702.1 hypothetical protein JM16_003741 [Phytophthora kernoviae]KAG2529340.1 hypothetical protein JM18_002853 [Phytophthora kernoviae]RLN20697.1 hypothetical protein BBI17_003457 [Phytophthora kernoviae]RLN81776.1 hypothetical protein BBO99_00003429 [Phytophthora kernoviae]